jgi:hypothetical protein
VERDPPRRIRPGVAITVTVVGLLLAVAACFFPAIFGAGYNNFHSLLATVLINIGTTLMLAAALIVVDKWLVHVEQVAEHRATKIVDDRTRELRSQTEDLATRVAALQEALDGRLAKKDADRPDRYATFAQDASFDTVTSALEAANDVGALATGSIVVPAGSGLDAPRVFMRWAPLGLTPLHNGSARLIRLGRTTNGRGSIRRSHDRLRHADFTRCEQRCSD